MPVPSLGPILRMMAETAETVPLVTVPPLPVQQAVTAEIPMLQAVRQLPEPVVVKAATAAPSAVPWQVLSAVTVEILAPSAGSPPQEQLAGRAVTAVLSVPRLELVTTVTTTKSNPTRKPAVRPEMPTL
jgi:hypothetical protein